MSEKKYVIEGQDVEQIVRDHGSPLYIYSAKKIEQQVKSLTSAFSHVKLKLKYACKALTNLTILKLVKSYGLELDCVSLEEVKLGLKAGYSPEQILFTPNSVSFREIEEGVELGVAINIDNISILEEFGHRYGGNVPCCVRINPHIMAGGNKNIQTGHIDSKFGISIYQLDHVEKIVRSNQMNINGLHMHTGSDILDSEVFLRGAQLLFDAAKRFPDLEFMDFGSGFKVAYKEGDITTDINDLGEKLTKAFQEFCASYGKELELWFEPGKYIVSEAGYLAVKANVIKTTPVNVFVGVDSGQNHLLRPMMYDAYHDIENISNPNGVKRIYSVVGYICETDTFGYDRKLSEVREGDILLIKNAGAYGYMMSSNYNSRPRPAEILLKDGKALLIRRRESLDDLLTTQIEVDL